MQGFQVENRSVLLPLLLHAEAELRKGLVSQEGSSEEDWETVLLCLTQGDRVTSGRRCTSCGLTHLVQRAFLPSLFPAQPVVPYPYVFFYIFRLHRQPG